MVNFNVSISCGTEVVTETIAKVDFSTRPFKLYTEAMVSDKSIPPIQAHSVIIATGATAKRLFLPGEDQYWQAGISACAVCDGAAPIFRDKPLAGKQQKSFLLPILLKLNFIGFYF